MRGCHGEYLVKSANASWQCYDDVAMCEQQVLAVAEAVAGNIDVNILEGAPSLLDDLRYYADAPALCRLDALAELLHKSEIASSPYQCVSVVAHPCCQLIGQTEEVLVDVVVGRAEYSYFHNCIVIWFIQDFSSFGGFCFGPSLTPNT